MLGIADDFYQELFKFEPRQGFKLNEYFFSADERVKEADNIKLEAPFTEAAIKKVVFDSFSDGTPGPYGIPSFFYQHFWDLIKQDLKKMFDDFHMGKLDLFMLNFAMLTLIPK